MSRNLNKLLNYSLLKISLIPIMLWIISSLVLIVLTGVMLYWSQNKISKPTFNGAGIISLSDLELINE